MKEHKDSPDKELNEMEASNLSDIEFKVVVIRMSRNLERTTGNLMGTVRNLVKTTSA